MVYLLFKITNEPPTDVIAVHASVPGGRGALLGRELARNSDDPL